MNWKFYDFFVLYGINKKFGRLMTIYFNVGWDFGHIFCGREVQRELGWRLSAALKSLKSCVCAFGHTIEIIFDAFQCCACPAMQPWQLTCQSSAQQNLSAASMEENRDFTARFFVLTEQHFDSRRPKSRERTLNFPQNPLPSPTNHLSV